MRYVIDRFEGSIAVLVSEEEGAVRNIDRDFLPEDAEAGWTVFEEDGRWMTDPDDTLSRQKRIREKMASVFRH